MTTLTARPTIYCGIQMRSRLEARFAAWLDGGEGMPWEYEPMAFANARAQYLPDFVIRPNPGTLSTCNLYIEIRPTIERAMVAMDQMPVVWDSEPTAILSIIVPDAGVRLTASPNHPSWSQHEWSWE